MAKYYVSCGNINVVIGGNHIKKPIDAAVEVMLEFCTVKTKLANDVKVSEIGFSEHVEDKHYDVYKVLKRGGFFKE